MKTARQILRARASAEILKPKTPNNAQPIPESSRESNPESIRESNPDSIRRPTSRAWRRFLNDERGYVAVIAALVMTGLMLAISLALDFGRFSYLQRDFGVALDSAAVALLRRTQETKTSLEVTAITEPIFKKRAASFIRANYPSVEVDEDDLTVRNPPIPGSSPPQPDKKRLELCGTLPVEFFFRASDFTLTGCSEITTVGVGLAEIALVLDMSLSMAGQRINTLKRVLVGRHDIEGFFEKIPDAVWESEVLVNGKPTPTVRFSIVPFASGVRLPERPDRSFGVDDAADTIAGDEHWVDMRAYPSLSNFDYANWIDRGQGSRLSEHHETESLQFPYTDDRGTADTTDDVTVNHRLELYEHLGIGWNGCVEARPYPYDTTDEPPVISDPDTLWVPWFQPDEPDVNPFDDDFGRGSSRTGYKLTRANWIQRYLGRNGALVSAGFYPFHYHDPDGDGIAMWPNDFADHDTTSGGLGCDARPEGAPNYEREAFFNSYLFDTGQWQGNLNSIYAVSSSIRARRDQLRNGKTIPDNQHFGCPGNEHVAYSPGASTPAGVTRAQAASSWENRMDFMGKYTPENWQEYTLRMRCFCGHGGESLTGAVTEPGYYAALLKWMRDKTAEVNRQDALTFANSTELHYYHLGAPIGGVQNNGRSCVRSLAAFNDPLDAACQIGGGGGGGGGGGANPFLGSGGVAPSRAEMIDTYGRVRRHVPLDTDGLFYSSFAWASAPYSYREAANTELLLAMRPLVGVIMDYAADGPGITFDNDADGNSTAVNCGYIADDQGNTAARRRQRTYAWDSNFLYGNALTIPPFNNNIEHPNRYLAACRVGHSDDDRLDFLKHSSARGCLIDRASAENYFNTQVRNDPSKLSLWRNAAVGAVSLEVGVKGITSTSDADAVWAAYEKVINTLRGKGYCPVPTPPGEHKPLAANYPTNPYRNCLTPAILPLSSGKKKISDYVAIDPPTSDSRFDGKDQMRPKGGAVTTIIPQGLVWGWRTLSPGPPFEEAIDYGPNRLKILVLLSDGGAQAGVRSRDYGGIQRNKESQLVVRNFFSAYGDWASEGRLRGTNFDTSIVSAQRSVYESVISAKFSENYTLNAAGMSDLHSLTRLSFRTEEVCKNIKNAAKDEGYVGYAPDHEIRIFTIAFGFNPSDSWDTQNKLMLQRCASDPDTLSDQYFFDASDEAGLADAFQKIVDSLGIGGYISK